MVFEGRITEMVLDGRPPVRDLSVTLAKGLGPLELEMLDVVWEMGRATSRDVFERMRDRRRLGQSTVLTVLRRLSNRGILNRETGGEVYVYSPAIGREELGQRMIDDVVNRVYGGAVDPAIDHLMRRKQG